MQENGKISVHTENIMPIIKQWLYSDKDIFVRELVSNGCDAVNKYQKLISMGQASSFDEAYRIDISIHPEEGLLCFEDNGIGMTHQEVSKYINQVAFSGAEDFIRQYQEQQESDNRFIGHFGLGFYSAFMVAEKVIIDTKSWQAEASAVRWESDGAQEYTISDSDRITRGTRITLKITQEDKEFLQQDRIEGILQKYCLFMPVEIFLTAPGREDKQTDLPINQPHPLWLDKTADCTDEQYIDFYHQVFDDIRDPLFWIHLNVDYPFNLKGIIYFPRRNLQMDLDQGTIKLYSNQVFVADNIKEVIPEFLLLLKGVMDCPDLPLNVSRSFLQNDGYVQKLTAHITKKVADKLESIFQNQREDYNRYWQDIGVFIKYGCLRDQKFYDRMKDYLIFKNLKDEYLTIQEYLNQPDMDTQKIVYYVSDRDKQIQYIGLFENAGLDAIEMGEMIDVHLVSFLEMQQRDIHFERVDAKLADQMLEGKANPTQYDQLINLLTDELGEKAPAVELKPLKQMNVPALLLVSEQERRMEEFTKMYQDLQLPDMPKAKSTLVLNTNHPLIDQINELVQHGDNPQINALISKQLYALAQLGQQNLDASQLKHITEQSYEVLLTLARLAAGTTA